MLNSKASALVTAAAIAALAAGCGSSKNYANNPRPAQLIIVTAAIADSHVVISPSSIGAGPMQLTVANETSSSQQVTLQQDRGTLQQQTAPINPGDTAVLKLDVPEGAYHVSVGGTGIHAAALNVGVPRPSSQNQLLQP